MVRRSVVAGNGRGDAREGPAVRVTAQWRLIRLRRQDRARVHRRQLRPEAVESRLERVRRARESDRRSEAKVAGEGMPGRPRRRRRQRVDPGRLPAVRRRRLVLGKRRQAGWDGQGVDEPGGNRGRKGRRRLRHQRGRGRPLDPRQSRAKGGDRTRAIAKSLAVGGGRRDGRHPRGGEQFSVQGRSAAPPGEAVRRRRQLAESIWPTERPHGRRVRRRRLPRYHRRRG